MVDRITPRTTDDDRAAVTDLLGVDDPEAVPTEPFSEWVLAGSFPAGRPAWDEVGRALRRRRRAVRAAQAVAAQRRPLAAGLRRLPARPRDGGRGDRRPDRPRLGRAVVGRGVRAHLPLSRPRSPPTALRCSSGSPTPASVTRWRRSPPTGRRRCPIRAGAVLRAGLGDRSCRRRRDAARRGLDRPPARPRRPGDGRPQPSEVLELVQGELDEAVERTLTWLGVEPTPSVPVVVQQVRELELDATPARSERRCNKRQPVAAVTPPGLHCSHTNRQRCPTTSGDRMSVMTKEAIAQGFVDERLPTRSVVGYGFGDFANNLAFTLSTAFLLYYYTDVAGLSAAAVATMFFVVRLWDAFADLFAGRHGRPDDDPHGQVPAVHPVRRRAAAVPELPDLPRPRVARRRRQAAVRLRHVRGAGPAVLHGQHPVRLAGVGHDAVGERARQARRRPGSSAVRSAASS